MDSPTSVAAALSAGVGKDVSGGEGCPSYPQGYMSEFHNYKLIWTPTWLAWYVDAILIRNESNFMRGMPNNGDLVQPGYVPWRPVTMRPLLRTNVGSAPVIAGTSGGKTYYVPAGIIQTLGGDFIANNTLTTPAGKSCYFTSPTVPTAAALTAAGCTAKVNVTAAAAPGALTLAATILEYTNGNCAPCNLLAAVPTGKMTELTLTDAYITFLPSSQMYIRRAKYTPYSPAAVAYSVANAVTWKSGPSEPNAAAANYLDATMSATAATPAPVPAKPLPPYQVKALWNVAGFTDTTLTPTIFSTAISKWLGTAITGVTVSSITTGTAYDAAPVARRALQAAAASSPSVNVNFTVDAISAAQETNWTAMFPKVTVAELKAYLGNDLLAVSEVEPTAASGNVSKTPAAPVPAEDPSKTVGVTGTGALPGGSGSPVNAKALSAAALGNATAGSCKYIEDAFEDDFNWNDGTATWGTNGGGTLNISRWLPEGSVNPKTGAVAVNGKYATPWGMQLYGIYQVSTSRVPNDTAAGVILTLVCTGPLPVRRRSWRGISGHLHGHHAISAHGQLQHQLPRLQGDHQCGRHPDPQPGCLLQPRRLQQPELLRHAERGEQGHRHHHQGFRLRLMGRCPPLQPGLRPVRHSGD